MRLHRTISVLSLFMIAGITRPVQAQGASALVGAWERVSLLDSAGRATQPPSPAAFLIFSGDGFYSQTAIPAGRPRVAKQLGELTREELLARVTRVEARYGTYTVAGNRLTRKQVRHMDPSQEGTDAVQLFRIEGDMLILTSANPQQKNEARFRRAR